MTKYLDPEKEIRTKLTTFNHGPRVVEEATETERKVYLDLRFRRNVDVSIIQGEHFNPNSEVNPINSEARLLYEAAEKGRADVVEALIKKGAKIEAVNRGFTALHIASERSHSHVEVVKLLLEAGASTISVTKDGETALDLLMNDPETIDDEALEIIDLLLNPTLFEASREGNVKVVERIIKFRPESVNISVTNDGQTPLHIALDRGHLEVVKILLDKGASLDAVDNHGQTPLQIAQNRGFELVEEEKKATQTRSPSPVTEIRDQAKTLSVAKDAEYKGPPRP
jgi:ankyrin repeat protein